MPAAALAILVMLFADRACAQKDAAEKAREGAIEHWIEYYKSQLPQPAAAPVRPDAPAESSAGGTNAVGNQKKQKQ